MVVLNVQKYGTILHNTAVQAQFESTQSERIFSDMRASSTKTQPTPSINRHGIFRRLINLCLITGIIVIAIAVWIDSANKEITFINKQSRIIGQSYIAQASRVHFAHLLGQDKTLSEKQLQQIIAEPYVTSISLMNAIGTTVFFANKQAVAPLTIEQQASNDYLIYIEPLLLEGQIKGFNRVILDKHQVQMLQREHYRQQSSDMLLLALLALMTGGLITVNFFPKRTANTNLNG